MTEIYGNQNELVDILKLREAIGVRSASFEISPNDFIELMRFCEPTSYEDLLGACDNIKAKYPSRADYESLVVRLDELGDEPRQPSDEEIRQGRFAAAYYLKQREDKAAEAKLQMDAWSLLQEMASPRLIEYMNATKVDQLDRLAWDARSGKIPPLTQEEISAIKLYYDTIQPRGGEFLRQPEYR